MFIKLCAFLGSEVEVKIESLISREAFLGENCYESLNH